MQEASNKKLIRIPGKNFIKRAKIVFSGKLNIRCGGITVNELIKTKICRNYSAVCFQVNCFHKSLSNFANKFLLMKRLLTVIFIFNLLVFSARAQNNADAQSILNKAAAKIQSSKGTSLSFSLTQKDKLGHTISSSKGIMKVKGSKYYIKQAGNEIYNNGEQIWNYDGQTEVTVAKVDNDDNDALSPEKIITGFDKKDFDVKLLSSSANYQVQLTPVDKRKNYKQVILYISTSTNLITKAIITDKTNAFVEINFTNITFNNTFPDNQFVFDASKHPGVDVVNQ